MGPHKVWSHLNRQQGSLLWGASGNFENLQHPKILSFSYSLPNLSFWWFWCVSGGPTGTHSDVWPLPDRNSGNSGHATYRELGNSSARQPTAVKWRESVWRFTGGGGYDARLFSHHVQCSSSSVVVWLYRRYVCLVTLSWKHDRRW